jgi:peptidoglycan/LPS O-acetylase OafA/YrhL
MTTKPPSGDKGRIVELDVLRGLAALLVMIYHYTVFPQGGDLSIPFGVFAVHLFFMISGFVIFMTLARTRTALDFVVSRFSRLFPVFWVAVLVTQTVVRMSPLPGHTLSWGEALVNLTMLAGPLHVRWVDSAYWSLVVELMFYAIMLGLFLVGMLKHIERLILPWLLLQIVAAIVSKATHNAIPQGLAVLLLLKYAHLFLAGILCYRIRFEGPTVARYLLLAGCLATQFAVKGLWAGVFGVVFFALFYTLARQRLAWIAVSPLVFLGTISYSLYLVHENIGYVIMRAFASFPRPVQWLAAMTTVLLLATLLTFIVEQPALRIIRRVYKQFRGKPSLARVIQTVPAPPPDVTA